jgi:hypothetical protein
MLIDPESGAIENFLWIQAQEGIKIALEGISNIQKAINPDYEFQVHKNLYRPHIEQIENTAMVNIRIGSVATKNETAYDATHTVTYFIDCYVRGRNEDDPDNPGSLVPADEAAVERLNYLVAMVHYGITALANFYFGLNSGEIIPGKIGIVFNPVEDAEDSATPYAPAQITFTCEFPYENADLTGLPELEAVKADLTSWASQIFMD